MARVGGGDCLSRKAWPGELGETENTDLQVQLLRKRVSDKVRLPEEVEPFLPSQLQGEIQEKEASG